MAKKSNFMKNLLTTASAFAVIAGGASSAYADVGDGFSRPNLDPATITNGGGTDFSGNAGGGTGYTPNYNIINSFAGGAGGAGFTVDAAATFGSFDVYGNNGKTITLNGFDLSLGAVYNSIKDPGDANAGAYAAASLAEVTAITGGNFAAGVDTNARVGVTINAAKTLTLTGGAAAANGGTNPTTMGAVIDLYTSLGQINFNANAGKLVANSASGNAITITGASVTNAGSASLDVTKSLVVDNASFAEIKNINIAAGEVLTFNVDTDIKNIVGATYNFGDNASSIIFNVDATGGKTIELYENLLKTGGPADDTGVIKFNSITAGETLTVSAPGAAKTIGTNKANRFTTIEFNGAGNVLLGANVTPYAKDILHSGTGKTTITERVDSNNGNAGTVSVNSVGELEFLAGVVADTATVNGGGTLTLRANSDITTTTITHGKLSAVGKNLTGDLVLNRGDATVGDVNSINVDTGGAVGVNATANVGAVAVDAIANNAGSRLTVTGNVGNDASADNNATLTVTGNINGTLDVINGGLVTNAGNVGGVVTINTANPAMNTIGNAAGVVTLTNGNLTMNNANGDVTVTAGTLTMNNTTGAANLIANGGVTNIVNAGQDVTLTNGAIVNQTGTIGRNLDVGGNSLYVGTAGASNVTGTVTINTGNDGINKIHDATGAVRLTEGRLTMNNASADVTVDNKANNVLVINDIINGANLIASGGQTTVHNIANDATLDNGAIVNVSGNIGGALALTANAGTVNFTGKGIVQGAVGNGGAITKITVADTTTFDNAVFKAGELNFTQSNAKAVFNNLTDFNDLASVTLSKDSKDNIIQINSHNAGNIANIVGEINKDGDFNALTFLYDRDLNGANPVNLSVNAPIFRANIESTYDKRLNVLFGNAVTGDVGNLGKDNAHRLNNVTFNNDAMVIVGNTYAGTIDIGDNKTAKFREDSTINADSLIIGAGGTATAIFAHNVILNSAITSGGVGKGIANFEGDVEINKAITGLEVVNFSNNYPEEGHFIAKLNNNISVLTVNAGLTALVAEKNVAVDSKTTAQNFGAEAGKTLTFSNTVGNTALTLGNDVGIYSGISADANNTVLLAGKTIIESTSFVDISGAKTIKIAVNDEDSRGLVLPDAVYTIFDNQGTTKNAVDLTTLNISKEVNNLYNDSLVKWFATSDKTKIYVTSKDNSEKTFEKNALENGGDAIDVQNLTNVYANGTAGQRKELFEMNGASRVEAIERMDPTDASAVVSDITTGISAGLGSRISSLVGAQSSSVQNKVVASNGTTGLSAGDDETRYGVWISPFFNQSVQKANKGSAGYTASTGGGSFGFDTKANDDMVVGLALSMLHSDVKYKNYKSGDKNKINSAMFSVYGMQQITDNWFGQGLITVGTSKVTTNEKRRVSNTAYQNATGTYNSMSFSGEALVGYNYVMSEVSITPMGGLRVSTVSDDGYTETGTTNQNLSIARKALNKAELVVGARVGGPAYDLNGVSVTPEVHGFLNQDMIGKNAKTNIKTSNGTNVVDKNSKPNKTSFNVGAGLDAKYSYMEYGIAYDANISKKFMSNQGTIKVRLNF